MWKQIQDIWKHKIGSAGGGAGTSASLTVVGQKWLGPGEVLRIVDVEIQGSNQRLALWSSKGVAQMVVLPEKAVVAPEATIPARGAACSHAG